MEALSVFTLGGSSFKADSSECVRSWFQSSAINAPVAAPVGTQTHPQGRGLRPQRDAPTIKAIDRQAIIDVTNAIDAVQIILVKLQ